MHGQDVSGLQWPLSMFCPMLFSEETIAIVTVHRSEVALQLCPFYLVGYFSFKKLFQEIKHEIHIIIQFKHYCLLDFSLKNLKLKYMEQ